MPTLPLAVDERCGRDHSEATGSADPAAWLPCPPQKARRGSPLLLLAVLAAALGLAAYLLWLSARQAQQLVAMSARLAALERADAARGAQPDQQKPEAPDKPGPVYDVKAYGAKGDGATDDTAAFRAALAAVPAAGGRVVVPAGQYVLSGPLSLGDKPVVIEGCGWRTLVQTTFGDPQWTAANAVT